MAQVLIKDVVKTYAGNVTAVDGISLDIHDGEFMVLVGPSGCGKSTTLRMIAGLEEITDGTISIGDRVVNEVAPKDRDIAMVFQNYALYPHMTVYKNMAFGLKLRKMPKTEIDERVRRAADILGIQPLLERKPKALSGGQRQRVALGRAIVRDPAVFLFDEPLSNLDAKLRVETRAEIKQLHQRLTTTTIYVTHDQEEAMTLGDRVCVMSNGHIQQAAPPLTIYNHPANRFVAGFVGTPPMNFFEGRLTGDGHEMFFEGDGFRVAVDAMDEPGFRSHAGQDVTLGLRPEGMSLVEGDDPSVTVENGRAVECRVTVIEPLGATMDIYGKTAGGEKIVARVDARPTAGLESVKLTMDPTKMHLFEPGPTGKSLRAGAEAGELVGV